MELQTVTLKKELVINTLHAVYYHELPKHYQESLRQPEAWELLYVDRGELILQTATDSLSCQSGDLFLFPPGQPHGLQGNDQTAANVLSVVFFCRSPILRGLCDRRLRPNTAQRGLLKDVLKESRAAFVFQKESATQPVRAKNAPIGAEQMIGCYMTELLISLLRQVNRPQYVDKKIGSAPMLDAIITYMEENLSTKMSLDILSREFHVSSSYIKRLFAQYKQTGAIKFFTQLKIEQAKKLLREKEKNVSQIAEDLGYDNIYYFCNQFKRLTGMSPMEYRRSVNAIGNWASARKHQEVIK